VGVGEGGGEGEQEQQKSQQEADKTFHRYYHLYRQGELEEDVRAAGGVVVESGYEKDNWWAIAERA
jgi:tRNA (uracil-5-)-methyltransferase TRM9